MALLDVTTGLPRMTRGPTLFGVPLKQISLITVRPLRYHDLRGEHSSLARGRGVAPHFIIVLLIDADILATS